jgi:hypothetical protein
MAGLVEVAVAVSEDGDTGTSPVVDALSACAARWEHGHPELTSGCALCIAEWDEAMRIVQQHPMP